MASKVTTVPASDFLAVLLIGAGSSFARGPDRQDTIDRCARIAVADWSSLYDLAGKEATLNVVDVSGHESVWWDDRGFHVEGAPDAKLDVELVKVTLPKKGRRR